MADRNIVPRFGHVDESPLLDALAELGEFAGDAHVLGSIPLAIP